MAVGCLIAGQGVDLAGSESNSRFNHGWTRIDTDGRQGGLAQPAGIGIEQPGPLGERALPSSRTAAGRGRPGSISGDSHLWRPDAPVGRVLGWVLCWIEAGRAGSLAAVELPLLAFRENKRESKQRTQAI